MSAPTVSRPLLSAAQRRQLADRIRAARERLEPIPLARVGAWLEREVDVQLIALLHVDPDSCDPGGFDLPEERGRRYLTDAYFHAWIRFEARIEAEKELARALQSGLPGAIEEFELARDRLLYSEGKRARFETDEEYRRAVTAIVLHQIYTCRETDWQALAELAQLRDGHRDGLFKLDLNVTRSCGANCQLVGTGIVMARHPDTA